MFKTDITELDQAIEYVYGLVGQDFIKVVLLANDIVENPHDYVGPQALNAALRLAAWRVRLGVVGSYYKSKPIVGDKEERVKKDAILTINDYLVELINCLKIKGRTEEYK